MRIEAIVLLGTVCCRVDPSVVAHVLILPLLDLDLPLLGEIFLLFSVLVVFLVDLLEETFLRSSLLLFQESTLISSGQVEQQQRVVDQRVFDLAIEFRVRGETRRVVDLDERRSLRLLGNACPIDSLRERRVSTCGR